MKPFSIILFSDIHYGVREFENQYPVFNAFVNDTQKMAASRENVGLYLFCVGDLAQAADEKQQYIDFKENIIDKISSSCKIPSANIVILPGNHDAQKSELSKLMPNIFDEYQKNDDEKRFNSYFETHKSQFNFIFSNFLSIVKECSMHQWSDSDFLSINLNEKWCIGCVNSALTSHAHINDYQDEGNLKITTRSLYQWIKDTEGKSRILLMHHPINTLSNWASDELRGIVLNNVDILVTGHTHNQDLTKPLCEVHNKVNCQLPHLFHDKSERAMGYCVLDFDMSGDLIQVQYREWNPRRQAFVPGTSFTEEEDGIVKIRTYHTKGKETLDKISKRLQENFVESMKVFENTPSIDWEERFVATKRIDNQRSLDDEDLHSEKYIIESDENFVILSPRDYGLTCYGRHLALSLWQDYGKISVFIENPNLKIQQLESRIKNIIDDYGVSNDDISWFIIDEWVLPQKQRKEIINYLQEFAPNAKLLFLSPRLEKYFTDNDEISIFDGFKYLYLAPLTRNQIRSIAKVFNHNKFIAEEEVLLKRLDDDIRTFNMHRSPMNCITLLYVFKNSFEENPVNRTEVLEKVLALIFDNDETPIYSKKPDQKDCRYALGKLCELLLKRDSHNYSFRKEDFISNINKISNEQLISVDGNYLFDLLLRNHIILPYDGQFRFRSSYWVYYFGAIQMENDSEFEEFMLKNKEYSHYPLIMEFYSGLNRKKDKAANTVLKDLQSIIEEVKLSIGIPENWNPFKLLKVEPSDAQKERLLGSLENQICGSNLPDEIKDSIADKDYDIRKPFHQDVYQLMEDYSVNKLMNFIPIASRVLRNSDYIDVNLKRDLFATIIEAWKTLLDTLAMFSPALAIQGHVTYGGASFEFVDDITDLPLNHRLLVVLGALPSNVIRWFEGDVYSERNAPLYYKYMSESFGQLYKHLVASLVIRQLPEEWERYISSYIRSISENSYYIMDAVSEMKFTYSTRVITDENASRLKSLMRESIGRMRTLKSFLSPKQISRVVSPDDIPERKETED